MDGSGRREREGGGRDKEPKLQESAAEFRTLSPHPVFKEAAKNNPFLLEGSQLPLSLFPDWIPGFPCCVFSTYILADKDLGERLPAPLWPAPVTSTLPLGI